MARIFRSWLTAALLTGVALAACGDGGEGPAVMEPPLAPHRPGQTDYVTEEPGQGGAPGTRGGADAGSSSGTGGSSGGGGSGGANGAGSNAAAPGATPPGGRLAGVEEADVYRFDHNRLFYLNTYRGLVIYDLSDPAQPRQVSRVPVFGHPTEMFVSGNTVFRALP